MTNATQASNSVEVRQLTLNVDRVLALTSEERYAYYMLGHMFNELMCLQKLLGYALPKHEDRRPMRLEPEMAQAMFLFRLAAGKMWEARVAVTRREMAKTLAQSFQPLNPDAHGRLVDWQRAVAKTGWLNDLRNQHSFHYAEYGAWKSIVHTDVDWLDDRVFMGERSGNTFYAGSDNLAQHWMFGQLDAKSPQAAVDPMIEALISLLGQFNAIVEGLLGAFIEKRLFDPRSAPCKVGAVTSPNFESVEIPFWTYMPSRSA